MKSMGKYKAFTQKKKLKIWDNEIKLIVQQKNFIVQEVSSDIQQKNFIVQEVSSDKDHRQ